jgi:5S rRNA maturation endonuclease (ribonuclease M5)
MASPGHDGNNAVWRILGLLERVKKSGSGWEASCPGPRHSDGQDRHPSLSVGLGLDGRVLLKCFTGCELEEILSPLGLSSADLFEKSQTGNPVRRFRLVNGTGQMVAEHIREDVLATHDKVIRWERNGKNGLGGMPVTDLPLYGLSALLAAEKKTPVVVCEGEKAAQALIDLGMLAVGTVTGAASTPSASALEPLQEHKDIWIWPDNDDPGREHMTRIAAALHSAPRWIDWKDAPEKGDAADYVAAGGSASGIRAMLVPVVSAPVITGPRIWTGPQLAAMAFDAQRWAIPEVLPAGLIILAGRPKLGKSWLALGWALDIARPALALKKLKVVQGETLYLALEDGPRRMQERQALMLGDALPPEQFHVVTEWPRTNEGGIDLFEQWLTAHPNARMVVVDTFKRIRPVEKSSQRLYDLDYDAIAPLAALARQYNVAMVLVFHTRKMQSDDPLEMVSGTMGVSGAADAVIVLRRERGQADASLFITGRDVEEQDLALRWEKEDLLSWTLLGKAEDFRRSSERQAILDTVEAMPGSAPRDIADALGKTPGSVRYLLFQMVRDAEVRFRNGVYYSTANDPNSLPRARARETNANSANVSSQIVRGSPDTSTKTLTGSVRGVSANSAVISNSAVSADVEKWVCRACGRDKDTHGPQDPIACQWNPKLAQKPLCPLHHVGMDDHECDAL